MSAEGGGTRMARPAGKKRGKRIEPPAPSLVARAPDAVATGPWKPEIPSRSKVLFLVANSTDAPVNAEVEEREIRDNLDGRRFTFEKVPDVRAEDLFSVMRDHQPAIMHFSGHGHGSDGLAMKNRDGKPTTITARELGLHFKDLARQGIAVRAVVLNACLAEEQAQAIAPYVDYVVGTSTLVGDETAVTFAANFYMALTDGRPVQAAFEAARARCGGEVEGTERIFRLFYSEPAAPVRSNWAPIAIIGAILAIAAVVGAVVMSQGETPPPEADAAISTAIKADAAAPAVAPDAAVPPDAVAPPPDASRPPPDAAKPVPDAAKPVAAKPTVTRTVRKTYCARDKSSGMNQRIRDKSCCEGPVRASQSALNSIKGSVARCDVALVCSSIKASCR